MECNCNNNDRAVIPWVRGNRLPLVICVYEDVVTQEGEGSLVHNKMERVPYEIQAADTVTVVMKSGFRQVEMPFTTEGNKVLVTDNGELAAGTYTVEVTIVRGDGARGRWQETRQVRVYENTSDAQLGEMYAIEADLFFYAKGDTGNGIADITANPDDTLTITMTDGTTYTTKAMRGEKGDKGDQGEKGTSIVSFDVTGQTDTSVIYTVTFSDDTTEEVAVPKGPQGDTGLTGNGIASTTLNSDYTLTVNYTDGTSYTTPSIRGAQGVQGVSVIGFTQTGETETNTVYNLVFSDGRTQSVAIPKGAKGDKGDTGNTGAQGAQGPKGDTVIIGDEQTYTLYGVTGQNSDGAMTQQAVTRELTELAVIGDIIGDTSKLINWENINFSEISSIPYYVGANGWTSYSDYSSKIIPIPENTIRLKITASAHDTHYYLLKSGEAPTATGLIPDYASGETGRHTISANTTITIDLPSDCTYIAVGAKAANVNLPSSIQAGSVLTLIDKVDKIEASTQDAIILAEELMKVEVVSESEITWTNGKGIIADKTNADYGKLSNSGLLKVSDYVQLKKGTLEISVPTYQSATTFGFVFYDENKSVVDSIVLPVTGSYGTQLIKIANNSYAYGRFVWFQSSQYGAFSIKTTYVDIIDEGDVKEIAKDVLTNGDEETISTWTSGKGLIATAANIGALNNSSVLSVSNFINVEGYVSIAMKLVGYEAETSFGYVWYDANQTPISGVVFEVTGTYEMYDANIKIPNNAVFLRTCKLTSYTSDFIIEKHLIDAGGTQEDNEILIAASDSTDFDKSRAKFVCTGTNDEVTINRAFSTLSPFQDLHFAKGTYYIDSFFASTDGEEDYVICSPVGTQNRHRLVCDDTMPCKTSSSAVDLGSFANSAKFVITSSCYEALDANKQYSIIRCNSYNGSRRYGANAIQVEGLSFVIPDNQKKIICIDAKWAAFVQVKNVLASAVANASSLKVPVEGCIGIRGTMGSNFGTGNWIEHCFVWGFYEGYAIAGEHLVCSDIGARFCNYGFTFNNFENEVGAWTHPITMINCADECNFNMPIFGHNGEYNQTDNQGGRQSITFINFNLEWLSSYAQYGGDYAKELTPGEWYGEIYYVIQTSYGGNAKNVTDIAFWADDGSGKNIKSVNQAQLQQTTKSVLKTYAPNYNQIVFLTDINMPVVCVNPTTKEWRDFAGNVITL